MMIWLTEDQYRQVRRGLRQAALATQNTLMEAEYDKLLRNKFPNMEAKNGNSKS